jgi:hydroxyacylglutathione hydrolase
VLVAGFPAGPPQTNCWVVAPAAGQQCVVIDPGIDAQQTLDDLLAEHRLQPVAVLLTHGHLDHTFTVTAAVLPVGAARGVPAWIHPADRGQLSDPGAGLGLPPGSPLFGGLSFAEPADLRLLEDGTVLDLAGLRITVDHAPGHTPGSVAFRVPGDRGPVLFSGDLLFAGSIGRTDLPGGDTAAMFASLARVCLPLPDETEVAPGHGPSTTIGRERASNPFLAELTGARPATGRG